MIISREEIERNKRNHRLINKTRKNNAKIKQLNETCIKIVLGGLLLITIILIASLGNGERNEAYNNCIKKGYSANYCSKNV